MSRYLAVLRRPHVTALVTAMVVSRLPIGINALAIVLYLREQTGSFAVAGGVSGALAFGSAIGAPVQGRLVDRIGARRVLLPIAVVHAISLGAFAWGVIAPRPLPRFGHGAEARAGDVTLLGCFHPSQQNTFTGKLTAEMIDALLARARELAA